MASFKLDSFLSNKSVLPTFRFYGEFTDSAKSAILASIEPYHIRSVSYEQHTFKQEGQYHGPGILKTFPVLDRADNGAYRLSVTLEEDKNGTVIAFIEYLKRKIIQSTGLYNSIKQMKDLQFHLHVYTTPEYEIQFKEVYFQTAEANDFTYGETDMKTYTITFAFDNYEIIGA